MSPIKTSAFKRIAHFTTLSLTLLTFSFGVAYSQQPVPRGLSLTRIRRLEIDAGSARLTVAEAGPGRFDYQLQDGRPEAPPYATGHCLRRDREFICTLNEQDGWTASLTIQDLDASLMFDLEIGDAAASFTVPKSSLSSYQSAEAPRGVEPPPDLGSHKVLLHDFAPHLPSVAVLADVLAHIDLDSPELRLLSMLCHILSPSPQSPLWANRRCEYRKTLTISRQTICSMSYWRTEDGLVRVLSEQLSVLETPPPQKNPS